MPCGVALRLPTIATARVCSRSNRPFTYSNGGGSGMVRSAGGYAESASVTILLPGADAHSSVHARHSSNEPSSERDGGPRTARAAFSPAIAASALNDWFNTACGPPNSASNARSAMGGKPLAFASCSHAEISCKSVSPRWGLASAVGNRKGVMLKFSYSEIRKDCRTALLLADRTTRCRPTSGTETTLKRRVSAQSSSRYRHSFTTWPNGRLSRAAACVDNLNHGSAQHTQVPGQAAAQGRKARRGRQ